MNPLLSSNKFKLALLAGLTISLVLIGIVLGQSDTNTEDNLIQQSTEQNETTENSEKAAVTSEPKSFAENPSTEDSLDTPLLAEETNITEQKDAPVKSTEPAPAVEEDPAPDYSNGASDPEGYIGFPPVCAYLWPTQDITSRNNGGSVFPQSYEGQLHENQTDVLITGYEYYIDDKLVQSSEQNYYIFDPSEPGTYKLHAVLNTNFGDSGTWDSCTKTLVVTAESLVTID